VQEAVAADVTVMVNHLHLKETQVAVVTAQPIVRDTEHKVVAETTEVAVVVAPTQYTGQVEVAALV
jgi:hypothetical protein